MEKYINTQPALQALCDELASSPWLAVDTEFIREKTYYPRLCLIQVANEQQLACIDPLTLDDLSPLLALLYSRKIVKVFHAAGQDLEIFYHLRGELPSPIFDTQPAAALLGHGDQIGYANLVKAVMNVELDKSQTRTDWSRRPLSDKQIDYALDDVRYLRQVYQTLHGQLTARNRLHWLDDELSRLASPDTYTIDRDNIWKRIKAASKLKGVKLNVLKHLARWREQRAMDADRPRKWILSDEILLDLATQLPETPDQLLDLRNLDGRNLASLGDTLLKIIADARQEPEHLWPVIIIPPKATPEEDAKADMITSLLRLRAAEFDIVPTLLATRSDIQKLLQGERDIPLLRGWRRDIAGETALDILEGRKILVFEQGRLVIKTNI